MASLRKLRRRLLRWERYVARIGGPAFPRELERPGHVQVRGLTRAWRAVDNEVSRRFWDETPEIWLGGPEGERALIADVLDWPPPTPDEQRRIDHLDACWDGCDDLHDDECINCGDPDCDGCWDDDGQGAPFVVTTTAFQEAGLL